MTDTEITSVHAWEALDSRGRPTVACAVSVRNGRTGRAVVPSGASTGKHEATELRDGGERYGGFGVNRAVGHVNTVLASLVLGRDVLDRQEIDRLLAGADPDPQLSAIGANATLSVSLAVTIAAAEAVGQDLWYSLSGTAEPLLPLPMVNIVSGGAHAGSVIDIQDVLVVPVGASSFRQAIEWAGRVRASAAALLPCHGGNAALVADEGGLAAPFAANEKALELVTEAIERSGLEPGEQVALAIDVAANQFADISTGRYRMKADGLVISAAELIELVEGWSARYPIVSIEDILEDDSWPDWQQASARLCGSTQLIGDDLFATNAARLRRGIDSKVANAILVKPNQAGMVSRAEDVVSQAREAGYATVVSARSGDTEDAWLADLAVGWQAGQIKVGSLHRSERAAKWNRLLEIESRAGNKAAFAGRFALACGPLANAEHARREEA